MVLRLARVKADPPLVVLDPPSELLPLLRELPELREGGLVVLELRRHAVLVRWGHPRKLRMDPPHERVRAPPPAQEEEARRDHGEPRPQVPRVEVAEARGLHPEAVESEAVQDHDDDAHDDPQGDAVERVVFPIKLPLTREERVDQRPSGQEEQEDEGEDELEELERHRGLRAGGAA